MAIFLGNRQPEWPNLAHPSPMFPHYGMRQHDYRVTYLAGFSDDAVAGSSIKITWGSGDHATRFDYYTKAGTAITDGAWNGGVTPGDAASAADHFMGYCMDDADAKLYIIASDTSTSPYNLQLVSVNKAGTVGTYSAGFETPSGTSFDVSASNAAFKTSNLIRTDGSGNFTQYYPEANLSTTTANAVHKYRGATVTFNASTGAMTEAHMLPDTALGAETYIGYKPLIFGPTSNNIMGGVGTVVSGSNIVSGPLLNVSTGNGHSSIQYPTSPWGNPGYPGEIASGELRGGRWRGYYWVSHTDTYTGSLPFYKLADIHTMLDEMAVKYGIL